MHGHRSGSHVTFASRLSKAGFEHGSPAFRVVDRSTELRWQLDQNCANKRLGRSCILLLSLQCICASPELLGSLVAKVTVSIGVAGTHIMIDRVVTSTWPLLAQLEGRVRTRVFGSSVPRIVDCTTERSKSGSSHVTVARAGFRFSLAL